MDSWRRQRSDVYKEATRTRSYNRKPPLGRWQPTVPSWEKKFCAVVGSVPWRQFVETKKFIYLYDNVLKWNDSAGKEAFFNAKNRFWATLNGLPCDISLPDPDIYIDKIDWNSNVDPELLLDLEREFVVPDDQKNREQVVILGGTLFSNQFFSSNGWGDAEDDLKMTDLSLANRGTTWEHNCVATNGAAKYGRWEGGWNNSQDWNPWETNSPGNEDETGRFLSGYQSPRCWGNDHVIKHGWTNGKGWKRMKFVCEQSSIGKMPAPRQWNLMKSCGPVSHHQSVKPGTQWGCDKTIS